MHRIISSIGAVALGASLLSACSSGGGSASAGDRVSVVASTNVYGDLAEQVGGKHVSVRSIISDPSQDPHSYEADTRTQLALSRADIVIENGGGYDDFVSRMLSSANADPTVLDAVTISGKKAPSGGELNEHVWYDIASVGKIVRRMADAFAAAMPSARADFTANAARVQKQLAGLTATEAAIRKQHAGTGVAITEPVPLYLLDSSGFVNRTPPAFSEAVEEGEDVPIRTLDETLGLFRDHRVGLLVYNAQTEGAETTKVRDAATQNDVPQVPVTETLPAGKDYVSWMRATLTAIESALA